MGTVELERGVICELRHIHIAPDDALGFGLGDKDLVSVGIRDSERSLAFNSVLVRVHPASGLELHIDTDEGNAAGIPQGATCYLESIDKRRPHDLLEASGPVTGDFTYIRWLGDCKTIEEVATVWNKLVIDRAAEMEGNIF